MKASPFYLYINMRSHTDYSETRPPAATKGCHVCGARPVLRVAGDHGFCKRHAAEAWAECARRTVEHVIVRDDDA